MKNTLLFITLLLCSAGVAGQSYPKLKEMRVEVLETLQPNELGVIEIDTILLFPDETAGELFDRAKRNALSSSILKEAISIDDEIQLISISETVDLSPLGLAGLFSHYKKTIQTKDGKVRLSSSYTGMGQKGLPMKPAESAPFKGSVSKKLDNWTVRSIYAIVYNKEKDFAQLRSFLASTAASDW